KYDLHRIYAIRRLLRRRLDGLMAKSSLVISGNTYLAQRAKDAGAKSVAILPTVVDLDRYPNPQIDTKANIIPVIVWIGSPSTVRYLKNLEQPLQQLAQRISFQLRVIGGGDVVIPGVNIQSIPWSEDTEVANITSADVGVMPLLDSPWERGKCGYKLIQYMACGLPVVGSPIGFNQKLIFHGRNGFLPNDPLKWEQCLKNLLSDRTLRKQMGEEGYSIIHQKYVLQELAERYLYALQ